MLNRATLIGRLAHDVSLRYTQQGTPVAAMTIAVQRDRPEPDGKRIADFIDVTIWGKMAEVCTNNLGTGRLVAVDGRLQVRSWTGRGGQKRKTIEVVANNVYFLDWPNQNQTKRELPPEIAQYGEEVPYDPEDVPF